MSSHPTKSAPGRPNSSICLPKTYSTFTGPLSRTATTPSITSLPKTGKISIRPIRKSSTISVSTISTSPSLNITGCTTASTNPAMSTTKWATVFPSLKASTPPKTHSPTTAMAKLSSQTKRSPPKDPKLSKSSGLTNGLFMAILSTARCKPGKPPISKLSNQSKSPPPTAPNIAACSPLIAPN